MLAELLFRPAPYSAQAGLRETSAAGRTGTAAAWRLLTCFFVSILRQIFVRACCR
jgi:hypothetical protein